MILTPRIVARIAAIVLGAVILQTAFFSKLDLLQTSIDITPLVPICLGLLGGSLVGATTGFATGLLLDAALVQTMGASSLVMLIIGYLAGRYREGFEISSSLVPPIICGVLTAIGLIAFAVLQLMLGVDAPVSLLVIRDTLVKSIVNIPLGAAAYIGIRRILRPALIDDRPGSRSPGPIRVA